MAKTFSVPSFSIPKVSVNTSALKSSMNIPDININNISNPESIIESLGGIQKPSVNDIKNALKSSTGITSIADVKNTLMSGVDKQDVTIPTNPEDVKDLIMDKVNDFRASGGDTKQSIMDKVSKAKDTITTVKNEGLAAGISSFIPQDYKDMKQTMEDAGMSVDIKDYIGKLKGGN